MQENDANDYIQFLIEFNNSVEDTFADNKIFEMLEIRIKYEELTELEDELKKTHIMWKNRRG